VRHDRMESLPPARIIPLAPWDAVLPQRRKPVPPRHSPSATVRSASSESPLSETREAAAGQIPPVDLIGCADGRVPGQRSFSRATYRSAQRTVTPVVPGLVCWDRLHRTYL